MLRFDELVVYPFPEVFSRMRRDSYISQIVTAVMSAELAVLIERGYGCFVLGKVVEYCLLHR